MYTSLCIYMYYVICMTRNSTTILTCTYTWKNGIFIFISLFVLTEILIFPNLQFIFTFRYVRGAGEGVYVLEDGRVKLG